jgi:hypothetical protein
MPQFTVKFDSGNDDRGPAWAVFRFENIGTQDARFGQKVAEFASFDLATKLANEMNRNASMAKVTFSPSLVAE